jgi:hypothetical protein
MLASGLPRPLKRWHRTAARDHHRGLPVARRPRKTQTGAVGQREDEVCGKPWHRGQRNPGRLAHPPPRLARPPGRELPIIELEEGIRLRRGVKGPGRRNSVRDTAGRMVSTKPTSAAGASLATKGRKAICQSLPILVFPGVPVGGHTRDMTESRQRSASAAGGR